MSQVDQVKKGILALIRSAFPRIDYFALYPSRVQAMNADGTLDLQPDDARQPGQQSVPVRLGIPGATVKVAVGSRVLLGFEAGDPQKPVATLWDVATLQELTITASTKVRVVAPALELDGSGGTGVQLSGGSAQVGRVGDAVVSGATMGTWIAAVNLALLGGGLGVPLVGITVPPPSDFGTISAGAAKVKA